MTQRDIKIANMIRSGRLPIRGGVYFDCFRNNANDEYAATILTNINTTLNSYVTEDIN